MQHGLFQRLRVADARELDQHRQVDARHHLDGAAVHARQGEVGGRAAEHVGQHDDAGTRIHAANRVEDVASTHFHIVVGADRDRLDLLLRADHVLEGSAELRRQLAVGDEHHSDHVDLHPSLA